MSISHRVESIRSCGRVICSVYHGREIVDVKERLKICGLEKTGFGVCSKIEEVEARKIVTDALRMHIWTQKEILDQMEAQKASDIFFSALPKECELYTNFIWGGIESISHDFIDQGVLAVSKRGVVGILWVIDGEEP